MLNLIEFLIYVNGKVSVNMLRKRVKGIISKGTDTIYIYDNVVFDDLRTLCNIAKVGDSFNDIRKNIKIDGIQLDTVLRNFGAKPISRKKYNFIKDKYGYEYFTLGTQKLVNKVFGDELGISPSAILRKRGLTVISDFTKDTLRVVEQNADDNFVYNSKAYDNGYIKDHFGNLYDSAEDLCTFYGLPIEEFNERLKLGWSLKDVLTVPKKQELYKDKRQKSLEFKQFLGYSAEKQIYIDPLGNKFYTMWDYFNYWRIDSRVVKHRYDLGYSLLESLCYKKITNVEYKGKVYKTLDIFCEIFHINRIKGELLYLMNKGKTLEEALTSAFNGKRLLPVFKQSEINSFLSYTKETGYFMDYIGNKFLSREDMLNYWDVDLSSVIKTRLKGNSLFLCLAEKHIVDHKDISYSSLEELCNTYNVTAEEIEKGSKEGKLLGEILTSRWNIEENGRTCTYRGVAYKDMTHLCNELGLNTPVMYHYIKEGFDIESAIAYSKMNKKNENIGKDNVNVSEVNTEKGDNLTKEEIIVLSKKYAINYKGIVYNSLAQLCREYNMGYYVVTRRLNLGWSMEYALETPVKQYKGVGRPCEDHEEVDNTRNIDTLDTAENTDDTTETIDDTTDNSIEEMIDDIRKNAQKYKARQGLTV